MNREYLGDSHDALQRLWGQVLADWAPLYAEPRFLPENIREDFTRLTGISVLPDPLPSKYSILNQADIGIRLPGEVNQAEGPTHICIDTIIRQLTFPGVRSVVTNDQSEYRKTHLRRDEQRQAKLRSLREGMICGFYYVSHARFLFAFPDVEALQGLQARLIDAGIPANRWKGEQV